MRKIRKNILPVLFVFALGIGMFGLSAIVFAASAKGPNPSKDSFAYVKIYQNKGYDRAKVKTEVVLYGSKNYLASGKKKTGKIKGAVYSKKKNTLTLNNFNHPTYYIEINEMGSDFKLVVKGTKNAVQNINVYGFGYGGSCAISGKGTLKVNANKKSLSGHGIQLTAEGSASALTIAKETTVKAWRNKAYIGKVWDEEKYEYVPVAKPGFTGEKGYPFFVEGTSKSSKGIVSKGKLSGKVKKTYYEDSKNYYNFLINADSVTSRK